MSKSRFSTKEKLKLVRRYLNGEGNYHSLAYECGIDESTLRFWVGIYKNQGEEGLISSKRNKSYSSAFKLDCVEAVISGKGSIRQIAAIKGIPSPSILAGWIKKYNANMELKDYIPEKEIYMASARRKTTIEERKEIVEYCINHGNDYKGTAKTYYVSYSQVYDWMRKYRKDGESGLVDRRGHRKSDDEVDELERLRRENLRLKRQLEERNMLNALLKKVKELEGR